MNRYSARDLTARHLDPCATITCLGCGQEDGCYCPDPDDDAGMAPELPLTPFGLAVVLGLTVAFVLACGYLGAR